MRQRLRITFSKYTNSFILWRDFIDDNDKLYPVRNSFIECMRENEEDLKAWAKKYYPELYKTIKYFMKDGKATDISVMAKKPYSFRFEESKMDLVKAVAEWDNRDLTNYIETKLYNMAMAELEKRSKEFDKFLDSIDADYADYFPKAKIRSVTMCFLIRNYTHLVYFKNMNLRGDIKEKVVSKHKELFPGIASYKEVDK